MYEMKINKYKVAQIKLPADSDEDSHPRLLFNGRGIHSGDCFMAWIGDDWKEIRIEMNMDIKGPKCWYIADPDLENISPIGLFCRVD